MRIGIPKEIKPREGRVALIPPAIGDIVRQGHGVLVQAGAGVASGFDDAVYRAAGAEVIEDARTIFERAQLIIKVKEPLESEVALMREEHILFSYLHLAANPALARLLIEKGLTAVAFETVEIDRKLPLLAPMSDIAGRLAVHIGTTLLHAPSGGRGIMLGGMPAADRGHVVILGAGEAGGNAARIAQALGAQVTIFERSRPRMEAMYNLGANVTALTSYRSAIADSLALADLLIGAVLIPGARAPHLVTREMVRSMRPGSVIIDISVDQGGCIETIRPTDYSDPTYVEEGVIHFGVTNMPAAVPRTASQSLSSALLPFVARLAGNGPDDPMLAGGINVNRGRVVHEAVAEALAKGA